MKLKLKYTIILIFGLLKVCDCYAQTFGPNNPSSGSNSTSIGSNAWSTTGNLHLN